MSFYNKNNWKIDVKWFLPWLGNKENFCSRLPKSDLNSISPFHLTQKHQICIWYHKTFINKGLY